MDTPGLTMEKLQSGEAPAEASMENALAVYKERLKTLTEMHGVKHNIFLKPLKERTKLRRINLSKAIKCEICGKGFPAQSKLVDHMRSHAVDKPFKCNICEHSFKSLTAVWKHMKARHPGYYMYKCEICQEPFEFMNGLKMHRFSVHNLLEEPRASVLLRTSEESSFSGDNKLEKQMCASFSLKAERPKPELNEENVVTRGDIDDVKETSESFTSCGRSKKLEKQICAASSLEKKSQSEPNLDTRAQGNIDDIKFDATELESEKTASKTVHTCEICDARFTYVSRLEVHKRVHTGDRPYSCHLCDSNFKQLGAVLTHFKKKHPKNKPYRCEFCLEEFSYYKDFKNHKYSFHELDIKPLNTTSVDGEESSSSVMSEKLSKSKASDSPPGTEEQLNRDAETSITKSAVTNELTCEAYCKEFKESHFPVEHRRRHADDRPFACPWCSLMFKSKSNLSGHLHVKHPGKKMYRCISCNLQFSRQTEWMGHNYSVHESGGTSVYSTLPKDGSLGQPSSQAQSDRGDELKLAGINMRVKIKEEPLEDSPLIFEHEGIVCGGIGTEVSFPSEADRLAAKTVAVRNSSCDTEDLSLVIQYLSVIVDHSIGIGDFKPSLEPKINLNFLKSDELRNNGPDKVRLCNFCGASYHSATGLAFHIRDKHQDRLPFQCQACPRRFATTTSLTYHLETHATVIPFTCGTCGMEFSSSTRLKSHESRIHLKGKIFTCDVCTVSFKKLNTLKVHRARHFTSEGQLRPVPARNFPCEFCSKRYIDKERRQRHIFQSHRSMKSFSCNDCASSFRTTTSLREHRREVHGVPVHQCDLCGDKFSRYQTLWQHASRRHGVLLPDAPANGLSRSPERRSRGGDSLMCERCARSFDTMSGLRAHNAAHHPKVKVQCELCDYSTPNPRYMKIHKTKEHGIAGATVHTCEICDKVFYFRDRFQAHRKLHQKVKEFFCEICDHASYSKANLTRHQYIKHRNRGKPETKNQ